MKRVNKKNNRDKLLRALEDTLLTMVGAVYAVASMLSFMFLGAVIYAMKIGYGDYDANIVLLPLGVSAWACMIVAFMIFYKEIKFNKGEKK